MVVQKQPLNGTTVNSTITAPSINTVTMVRIGMNAERAFSSVMALVDDTGEGLVVSVLPLLLSGTRSAYLSLQASRGVITS